TRFIISLFSNRSRFYASDSDRTRTVVAGRVAVVAPRDRAIRAQAFFAQGQAGSARPVRTRSRTPDENQSGTSRRPAGTAQRVDRKTPSRNHQCERTPGVEKTH